MGAEPDDPDVPEDTAFMPSRAPTSARTQGSDPSAGVQGHVAIGDVLNGIYEVKRLVGRGGMGEVYEGANINSDERVAIKVMLPALAADANVQAMFRKEARTLTRLAHPAVVQYRVLAQEPNLHVLYIVTEFVDGVELSNVFGKIHPTSTELRALIRRLAEGLRAAHDLGAVHRDLSPDNVLLPEGRLERAKIIDFGIAKDLDSSKGTLIGDGFAGKLGYVAPEQFGDFGREIGPWTDVYSLGLVILALASGRNVDMGATLVEAVDKRRAGVDLSSAPDDLRPLLAAMLAADPARRLRSMDAVLALLDDDDKPAEPQEAPRRREPQAQRADTPAPVTSRPRLSTPLALAALAVAALIIAGVVFLFLPRPPAPPSPAAPKPPPPAGSVLQVVSTALPSLSCTWLDVAPGSTGADGTVKLVGAAGSPDAVRDVLINAAKGSGATITAVGMDDVALADQSACAPLDAFRAIRAPTPAAGPRLSTSQSVYDIARQPDGKLDARLIITLAPRDKTQDFALLGLDPGGKLSVIVTGRKAFDVSRAGNNLITDLGGDAYRLQIDSANFQGWAGLVLLTGTGPFDQTLLAGPSTALPDTTWLDAFRKAAASGGWKADMVWYKVEGDTADSGATLSIQRKPPPPPRRPHYASVHTATTSAPASVTAPATPPPTAAPAKPKTSIWKRIFG